MTKVTASSRSHSLGGGGVEYIVKSHDTLEGIAARYDCTPTQLLKMNKLSSRLLFPGQKIFVPASREQGAGPTRDKDQIEVGGTDVKTQESSTTKRDLFSPALQTTPSAAVTDSTYSATGGSSSAAAAEGSSTLPEHESPAPATVLEPQLDADCLQRFLKIRCKHFTDNEGVVSGVLLVTPNCVMFDPDVSHPLVIENGADQYGMVVAMDTIVSAALYKDASVLVDEYAEKQAAENCDKADVARRLRLDGSNITPSKSKNDGDESKPAEKQTDEPASLVSHSPVLLRGSSDKPKDDVPSSSPVSSAAPDAKTDAMNDAKRAELEVELAGLTLVPDVRSVLRRHVSDSGHVPSGECGTSEGSNLAIVPPRAQAHSCPSQLESKSVKEITGYDEEQRDAAQEDKQSALTPKRASLSKLRHSLRNRANTLGGSLVQGAQAVGSGVGTLGGSLVHGAQAVGGTLTTGAKAVVKMPQNLVNMSSGLFAARSPQQQAFAGGSGDVLDIQESWFSADEAGTKAVEQMRKKQLNYALLARLQQKTAEARQHWMNMFACATSKDEHPNLFAPVEDMLPYPHQLYSDLCTELPYYLCIRLDDKRRQRRLATRDSKEDYEFGNKTKTEFWFTVPRDKADTLYAFLIQWTPDFSEEEPPTVPSAEPEKHYVEEDPANKSTGFVVLDVNDDEAATVQDNYASQPGSLPASLSLNREWEIVTVEEVKRRLSLLDLLETEPQPLPEGSHLSELLDEDKVRRLMEVLPARAQGYPWVLVYSSDMHGFSLRTLYRNMLHWDEEISPTLLVIKDSNCHLFGAIVNCPLRVSEHFYGSGESLLFTFHPEFSYFRWTGENSFIVKGNNDSLSFGAGRGVYGLWLDGDLYHGRTQHCLTFDNVPLAGEEDFIIAGVEAWGFSLSGI